MAGPICIGDCVRIPDKRARRVREKLGVKKKVRVRRMTGQTYEFLIFPRMELKVVECPVVRISQDGYNRTPEDYPCPDAPAKCSRFSLQGTISL